MNITFKISLPRTNTRYSSRMPTDRENIKVVSVSKQKAEELVGKSFDYDFGDGWWAEVSVSKGGRRCNNFLGYDWMIDEILKFGHIVNVEKRDYAYKLKSEISTFINSFIAENGKCDVYPDFLLNIVKSEISKTCSED